MKTPANQARLELRRIAGLVRGLLALDEELGELGTIENQVRAQQNKLAELIKQEEAQVKSLAAARAKAEAGAKQHTDQAVLTARELMDRASADAAAKRKEADAVLAKSYQDAAQAQQKLVDAENSAKAELTAIETERDNVERAVTTAQATLQATNDQVIAAAQQRDEIVTAIEQLRRRLS